jgi:hypothetical protein
MPASGQIHRDIPTRSGKTKAGRQSQRQETGGKRTPGVHPRALNCGFRRGQFKRNIFCGQTAQTSQISGVAMAL